MKAIINTKLIMVDGIIWDGAVTYEDGKIVQVGKRSEVDIPEGTEIIDAKGLYTAPGLIDIHNHGGGGEGLFYEDPMGCCEFFLKHGQTTVLPTFYMNMSPEKMRDGAQCIRDHMKTGAGRIMAGLYMEGPFMRNSGSFAYEMRFWAGKIPEDVYKPLIDDLSDLVKVWAIDPQREGIDDICAYINQATPKAVISLGHSGALSEECRRMEKYGLKLQTHHSNAGKAAGRCQGSHGAGVDEYTLYNPDMYAELICDVTGIHVVPDMVKMVVRIKGVEKMILITDHMQSDQNYPNNEADGIWYGEDLNYDNRGYLAGSHLTLDNAVRNMMTHTGYGLCHAIRMATYNPAKMLGMEQEIGSLAPGLKANLIIMDDAVNIKTVILEGDTMVEN